MTTRQTKALAADRPEIAKSVPARAARSGERLTDKAVRELEPPATGNRITYDGELKGFGVRITAAGAKSFILNYRIAGRERRLTIGAYPAWSVAAARKEAEGLIREIDRGIDPLGAREAERAAATVNELADRYLAEHAEPKKRTAKGDRQKIDLHVRPRLGPRKVKDVTFAEIDRLHREISKTAPYMANRVAALLSKMMSLAIRWEMRTDNPCRGIERNPEERRYRYLGGEELRRLTAALAAHPRQAAANAIRLLLLTGARSGEVLAASWGQFDLEAGIWTKPSSHTKQKREHRVPLSAPARQLLAEMRAAAERARKREPSPFVFPTRSGDGHLTDLKRSWASLCKAAQLDGVRVHDLRHTYASVLASAGLSLPVIGALLGHTQPGTTARYSHLFDDPLRAATERVGAIVTGSSSSAAGGEVTPLRRQG
jgi:integrase